MNPRKPHSGNAGYVCELQAWLGGHVVVYDREAGFECDAAERWIVMHEPSSRHVAVHSERVARSIMQGVARARTINEAMRYADILPAAEATPEPPQAAGGRELERALERFWNASGAEELDVLREIFRLPKKKGD